MQPEELLRAARARSRTLPMPAGGREAALERLRQGCAHFFSQVPEPPVYLRREDPLLARAAGLRDEGAELLAVGLALLREGGEDPQARALLEALESYLAVLCFLAVGKLKAAEEAWLEAGARERHAAMGQRHWTRSDEAQLAVFDRASGVSRYDPREEATLSVKLCCPACRQANGYQLPATGSLHGFSCPHCRTAFLGFFGDVRGVSVRQESGARHFTVEVDELDGAVSRVEFQDASRTEFSLARRDFVGFVYSDAKQLRSVVNLTSGRILWVTRPGACFVATAAFGEDAPELAAFRRFRDEVLWPRAWGRAAVRLYYRAGPTLAGVVVARPVLRTSVRRVLRGVHGALVWYQARRRT
ncbi:MAG: hypothetical protein L0Y66_18565 [Myxococcaceae bacterium]|nr:hypothetical protein [Myxococcaceae bacterium]